MGSFMDERVIWAVGAILLTVVLVQVARWWRYTLPLALGCRRHWRLGYRRGASTAGVTTGVPVWIAWWGLAWRAWPETVPDRLRSRRYLRGVGFSNTRGGDAQDSVVGNIAFAAPDKGT